MGVILSENTAALEKLIDLANNLPDAEEGTQPVIESLSVTANGTYAAPDGTDGYSPVTVNVPIPDGYIVPSGTKTITENGTHDVTEYASVVVDVGKSSGLAYDIGTFTVDEDTQYAVSVPHNLGSAPYFMLVWTDHWSELTPDTPNEYTTATNVGVVYMRGLTGMTQRLTSVVSHTKPLQAWITMAAKDYRAAVSVGTSPSYGITTYPTDTTLTLGKAANNTYWRSGVTYNYLVTAAWWDAHE